MDRIYQIPAKLHLHYICRQDLVNRLHFYYGRYSRKAFHDPFSKLAPQLRRPSTGFIPCKNWQCGMFQPARNDIFFLLYHILLIQPLNIIQSTSAAQNLQHLSTTAKQWCPGIIAVYTMTC